MCQKLVSLASELVAYFKQAELDACEAKYEASRSKAA
jgi:hypothetical protein